MAPKSPFSNRLRFTETPDIEFDSPNFITNKIIFRNVYRRSTHVIIEIRFLVFRKYIILAAGSKFKKKSFFFSYLSTHFLPYYFLWFTVGPSNLFINWPITNQYSLNKSVWLVPCTWLWFTAQKCPNFLRVEGQIGSLMIIFWSSCHIFLDF